MKSAAEIAAGNVDCRPEVNDFLRRVGLEKLPGLRMLLESFVIEQRMEAVRIHIAAPTAKDCRSEADDPRPGGFHVSPCPKREPKPAIAAEGLIGEVLSDITPERWTRHALTCAYWLCKTQHDHACCTCRPTPPESER